jgi:hypothetical protein
MLEGLGVGPRVLMGSRPWQDAVQGVKPRAPPQLCHRCVEAHRSPKSRSKSGALPDCAATAATASL